MQFIGIYDDHLYYYIVTEVVQGGELFDRLIEKEVSTYSVYQR